MVLGKITCMKHLWIILLIMTAGSVTGQPVRDTLLDGFRNPPDAARPRTWWHWTGGNVTRQGITKDLEWMERSGIAGFQLADVAFGGGQVVEEPVRFGSQEWLEAVRHSAEEAKRLGLEMSIFSSAGWSLTGGPWVQPEQAMKKLVWSGSTLKGPVHFSGQLPSPPAVNGPIRDMKRSLSSDPEANPSYYGDQVVIAFPTPPDEQQQLPEPEVTTHEGILDAVALLDGSLNTSVEIGSGDAEKAWIQYTYELPVTIRAVTIASRTGIPFGKLTASMDGETYHPLVYLPGTQNYRGGRVRTWSVPETKARFFRLELTGAPPSPAEVISQTPPGLPDAYSFTEFILHSGSRVHRWEDKAGFSLLFEYGSTPTPPVPETSVLPARHVVNLSDRMDENGILSWDVPEGDWTVLRMGYSLTGAKNRPARPGGLGYEVDKLNETHTRSYMETYLDMLEGSVGPLLGETLQYILMDSWEAGMQNWTDDMIREFESRRGYDPVPFLPAMAGYVVGSAEISDRFLWDFRRTLVEMFAENHYGTITELAHEKGMGTYSEASGVSLEVIEDALLNKKYVDIPMGEFWVRDLHPGEMYHVDVRGAASAAHVYGKPFVAAEAYTGSDFESPFTLKRIGDYWFTQGVNRFVFHTSTHQPLDTKPGNAMVGTHLHRNITWAEQAGPFVDYIARTSWMLQQGHFVADLVYLLEEGGPSTMPFWSGGLKPQPPEGYDYDYINADALLTRLDVDEEGNLVLPDGISYKVLVLPQTDRMTLPVLRKVRDLVMGGATILGPKITASPGLNEYPESEKEVLEISGHLWGDLDGVGRTVRHAGRGLVAWGEPLTSLLERTGILPDVDFSRELDADYTWIHKRSVDRDIYFVSNRTGSPRDVEFRFRVSGMKAECWDPGDGSVEPLTYYSGSGVTTVPLQLPEYGAVFVVFQRDTEKPFHFAARPEEKVLEVVSGPWELTFLPGPGNPGSVQLDSLISWTDLSGGAMKYFSGSARYSKTFRVPGSWISQDRKIMLDLGEVRELAEVKLNGNALPLLWKEPFRAEVTSEIRKGTNELEITVTNLWTNRLAGDERLPEEERVLDMFLPKFFGNYQVRESGLLGPVKLIAVQK